MLAPLILRPITRGVHGSYQAGWTWSAAETSGATLVVSESGLGRRRHPEACVTSRAGTRLRAMFVRYRSESRGATRRDTGCWGSR